MNGFLQILGIGSILALSACNSITQVDKRGYVESKPIGDRLVVGTSTQADVRNLLGSPSTVSDFPPQTWYYVSRQQETVAFLAPEITQQKVARIEFDDAGKVSKIDNFGMKDMREMQYVARKTPTEGRSFGIMEQLLGNLGRFNTPRDATQARQ